MSFGAARKWEEEGKGKRVEEFDGIQFRRAFSLSLHPATRQCFRAKDDKSQFAPAMSEVVLLPIDYMYK
jgi:hypothetical protein